MNTFSLRIKDGLLYALVVAAPLFNFAVLTGRDQPAVWVVVAMLLVFAYDLCRTEGRFWADRVTVYLLVVLAVYLASTVYLIHEEVSYSYLGRTAIDRALGIDIRLIYVVLSFVVFVHFLADAPDDVFRKILTLQLGVGVALALFGILQYVFYVFAGSGALSGIEPTNEAFALRSNLFQLGRERVFRSSSIFSEPSFFGFFLLPVTVKAVVAWGQGLIIGSRGRHAAMIAVFLLAVVTNFSFTSLFSVTLILLVFFVISLRSAPRRALSALALLTGLGLLLALTPVGAGVVQRISQIAEFRDLSVLDRLFRLYTSGMAFLESPLFGIGPGGYAFWYPRLGGLDSSIMATPLNVWMSFLTDVGIIGFIPFVMLFWVAFRRGIRATSGSPLVTVFLWGCGCYLILLTSLDFWFLEAFWFELALLVTLSARTLQKAPGRVRTS